MFLCILLGTKLPVGRSDLRFQCPLPVRFSPFLRIRRTDGDTAFGYKIGSCTIGRIPGMDDLLGMLYSKAFKLQLQSAVVGENAGGIASLIKANSGFLFFAGGFHAFAPFSEPNSISYRTCLPSSSSTTVVS